VFCIVLACIRYLFSGLLFAQKMTVKDSGNNVLMEVNGEGNAGSIVLPRIGDKILMDGPYEMVSNSMSIAALNISLGWFALARSSLF
jgi:hypothetical protein